MRKLIVLASLIVSASAVFGQNADALYVKGFNAYNSYRWKDAANYLWRYLNYRPQPADLADPSYFSEVNSAYAFARSQYRKSLQNPVPSDDPMGSSVAGLSTPPPPLRKPRISIAITRVPRLDVSGSWTLKIYHTDGNTYFCSLNLSQDGENITGTLGIVSGTDMPIVGTMEAGVLTFACVSGQTTQSYTLTTTNYKYFSGSFTYEGDSPEFGGLSMTRR
jgi:hypothetical protein